MSSLVASAAGEVLGPRPGKAACSFCQGMLEMVLRVGALVSIIILLYKICTYVIIFYKYFFSASWSIVYCWWCSSDWLQCQL